MSASARGQDREPVAPRPRARGSGDRSSNSSTPVASSPRPAPSPEPAGVLRQCGRERRHRLRVEGGAGRVLDRQAVAAQEQHGLHAVARGEALDHLSQLASWSRTPGQRETLRNVGTVPVEVKK